MGFAGFGVFDNDYALDVVEEWDRRMGSGSDGKSVVTALLDEWGDGVLAGSQDMNQQVLALVGLSLKF